MNDDYFKILGIIAARKSAYYISVRDSLLTGIKKNKALSDEGEAKIRHRLRKTIAQLPNELFLSDIEKRDKKVDGSLSIGKLRLDKDRITSLVLENV